MIECAHVLDVCFLCEQIEIVITVITLHASASLTKAQLSTSKALPLSASQLLLTLQKDTIQRE